MTSCWHEEKKKETGGTWIGLEIGKVSSDQTAVSAAFVSNVCPLHNQDVGHADENQRHMSVTLTHTGLCFPGRKRMWKNKELKLQWQRHIHVIMTWIFCNNTTELIILFWTEYIYCSSECENDQVIITTVSFYSQKLTNPLVIAKDCSVLSHTLIQIDIS